MWNLKVSSQFLKVIDLIADPYKKFLRKEKEDGEKVSYPELSEKYIKDAKAKYKKIWTLAPFIFCQNLLKNSLWNSSQGYIS